MLATLQDLLQKSTDYLAKRDIDNARRESEWLFCHALGLERLELYTRYDMPLDEAQVGQLRALISRRGKREPLAYLLGNQPFMDLNLLVSPAVLVPRPETEQLVERILADDLPAEQALPAADIGTGSGAIALALAQARPAWQLHATDASAEALAIARANAERHQLRVSWHQGHLGEPLPQQSWQLLVANLPYIGEHERALCSPEVAFEPAMALFAEDRGLALIRALITWAADHLASNGRLWLEHGFGQAEAISDHCQSLGLACRCERDLADFDRFTRVWRA